MFIRRFSLIFLIFCLAGCGHPPEIPPPASQISQQKRDVPAFNQVDVAGIINVSLHSGYKQPHVILRGDYRDLLKVTVLVTQNTLHIIMPNYPRYGSVQAEIRGRYLNVFKYHGAGIIVGKHLRANPLDVTIANPGKTILKGDIVLRHLDVSRGGYTQINGVASDHLQVHLSRHSKVQLIGVANLSTLDIDGDGWFGMFWVKSRTLIVRGSGQAFIQLAGVVDKLDVDLKDHAQFHGRFLRAKRAFVKTHGKSVAEITALKRQHVLATDGSDIYFYKIPQMKTDFMAFDGAALDMRDWSDPFIKDYDRYNK